MSESLQRHQWAALRAVGRKSLLVLYRLVGIVPASPYPNLHHQRPARPQYLNSGRPKMPNTVRLHRMFATAPEKLYRAFLEPVAMAKWLPPDGFAATVHSMEA